MTVCRDRVSCVWQTVRDHLYQLCVHANESCFLVERSVVGLLRLAIRLLRREDIGSQVHTRKVQTVVVLAVTTLINRTEKEITSFLPLSG